MKTRIIILTFLSLVFVAQAQVTNDFGCVAGWVFFRPTVQNDVGCIIDERISSAKHTMANLFVESIGYRKEKSVALILDEESWVQLEDNDRVEFSGWLQFNSNSPYTNKLDLCGFSNWTNSVPGEMLFPHAKGITGGELSGALYVVTSNNSRYKVPIGTNHCLRIRFGNEDVKVFRPH